MPNNDQPYLYMSLLLKERTIDLSFSEESIKKWFYGLYYHLKNENQSYKIISCTNFIINRVKSKMNYKLANSREQISNRNNDKRIKFQKNSVNNNITFVKSLLLYIKENQ